MIKLNYRHLEISVKFNVLDIVYKRVERIDTSDNIRWYSCTVTEDVLSWLSINNCGVFDKLENEYQELINQGVIDKIGRLVVK